MSEFSKYIYIKRNRESQIRRNSILEEFYSDKSRIVFSSSFRRLMQKAQVFSLETNPSVRNRLTHTLEVADIGRTLARKIGEKLVSKDLIDINEIEIIQTIVENACLIHDIGNPPFGHFGEEAIKIWFKNNANKVMAESLGEAVGMTYDDLLSDFYNYDGNPQGLRIVSMLHAETDKYSLNLTYSSLLASLKYPYYYRMKDPVFKKKIGVFDSEIELYRKICQETGQEENKRYFLVYLMELADDICYCLSDIADSFEKGIISSRDFKEEYRKICEESGLDPKTILPDGPITNFSRQISVEMSKKIIDEATNYYVNNIESFISGTEKELSDKIELGKYLECLKTFARKFIYTDSEAQRIEIAGNTIVYELLKHFSMLLKMKRTDFEYFSKKNENKKGAGFDVHWRVYNQLSHRMVKAYNYSISTTTKNTEEWLLRAHLITDYISGLTDASAKDVYQNFKGISV